MMAGTTTTRITATTIRTGMTIHMRTHMGMGAAIAMGTIMVRCATTPLLPLALA
jgi:hypothetical protein